MCRSTHRVEVFLSTRLSRHSFANSFPGRGVLPGSIWPCHASAQTANWIASGHRPTSIALVDDLLRVAQEPQPPRYSAAACGDLRGAAVRGAAVSGRLVRSSRRPRRISSRSTSNSSMVRDPTSAWTLSMSFFCTSGAKHRRAEDLPPRRHRAGELLEKVLDAAAAAAEVVEYHVAHDAHPAQARVPAQGRVDVGGAHAALGNMTCLRVHDDAVGEVATGDDGLAVGAVGIHRVNASPLNSRRNNRAERVAPDEAFVLVAWSTVMVKSFHVAVAREANGDRNPGATQFDDFECRDLLHAGRAGYLYCFLR
jgi:hypothetical protein